MNSTVIYTEEIDDLEEAAEELFAQAEQFAFCKNSLAILFTEEETEYPELYRLLSAKWDFPIIGCTAMAMLLGKEGYCNTGISVMLLSADDCSFTVGMTDELNVNNYEEQIGDTYRALLAQTDAEVKLVISYGGMLTKEEDVAGDNLVSALNAAADGVPIYGGTASDGFSFDGFRVFCNGQVTKNGQVMALVTGEIRPKFVRVNSVENMASFSYEVTQSRNNVVYRLGNGTLLDALKKEDMVVDKADLLGDYLLSPFVVTVKQGDGEFVEVARNLSVLNQETGAGSFLGVIPEGAILNIGIINRADVKKSVEQAFDTIFQQIQESEYPYRTLLCNSCCARFLALASNTSAEVEAFEGRLPEGISLMGLYAYGEYCPVKGNLSGKDYNMFHNFTFTILAL